MLSIAGGTYLEYCLYPRHSALLGSAGRAALAIADMSDAITLYTAIESRLRENLELSLGNTKIRLQIAEIQTTLTFSYFHSLSNPDIQGLSPSARSQTTLNVSAANILRFGMLDGTAIVHGRKVVYDPQSPNSPELFHANGSSAEQLVYVCNEQEAKRLTGMAGIIEAGEALLTRHNSCAAVIKCGAWGARWFTPGSNGWVAANQSARVFKIGSGDIFSGVFAHYWAELGLDIASATRAASEAVSFYCGNRTLPLFKDREQLRTLIGDTITHQPGSPRPRIYLAAPFFSMSERWMVEEARTALKDMGADVFSPLHDVGYGEPKKVAQADIEGLKSCSVLLALADGHDPGTVFEVGYAKASDMPIVIFVDNIDSHHTTMMRGTGCDVVSDFATAIYHALWCAVTR